MMKPSLKEGRVGPQADSLDPDRRRREFDRRTVGLVIDQFRRHILPETILLALLAGVGLPVDDE
jgi:hypothetical protein